MGKEIERIGKGPIQLSPDSDNSSQASRDPTFRLRQEKHILREIDVSLSGLIGKIVKKLRQK